MFNTKIKYRTVKKYLTTSLALNKIITANGASPSGKAPGFGPGISEVRILPPQPIKL